MKVPLAVPNLDGREAEYLEECIRSTFVSSAGPFVSEFRSRVAALSGTPTSSATCSGTVALQMALEALGIGRGDLVMVPSLTFIATPNAVRHTGADVWLVDSRADSWTLDVDLARAAIESETEPHPHGRRHRATGEILRAIMPVMIMGASMDFEPYVTLGADYGLKVVVDAAAAIGATGPDGVLLGATGVDAVCYSFNGNKTVTSGGGGAVAALDEALVERIEHVISTGRIGAAYDHDVVAYNFRMTNVEAAIGVAQLERLDLFIDRKHQVFERYAALAAEFDDLRPFPSSPVGRSTHWFSGLVFAGADTAVFTDFRQAMVQAGIDARPFWKPIHLQTPYRSSLRTTTDVADGVWERILPLPCSSGITDEELDYVVEHAQEFWTRRGRSLSA
jgi:dTDP-4-amino-4,6-dideoxygalactose transaminase